MLKPIFVLVFIVCWTTADTDRSFLISEFDFALSLLNKLPSDKSCIISPFSISLALSLVHSGTKGTSRKEIEQLLLKGAANEEFSQHFSNLIHNMSKIEEGVQMEIANRLFLQKGNSLLDSYLSSVRTNYKADAVSLDFNDSNGSAETVNSFVRNVTHEKIKEIVTPDMIDASLLMILVNVLYMDAEWENKFDDYDTEPGIFFVSESNRKNVDFLSHKEVIRDYYENDQYQLLSVKYKDNRYRFNVFLPKQRFMLEKLQSEMSGDKIEEVLNNQLKQERLNILLPKFKLESDLELSQILKDLGIVGIFNGGEDLSGFTGTDNLDVSRVIHKATIEVGENGTVASAVTAVVKYGGMSFSESIYFNANNPFIFCITFDSHPLFIGKYY